MIKTLARHWPEYAIEAALLGIFMVMACAGGVLIEHPGSPARRRIARPLLRRALMGLLMGVTAVVLIYSPWGKRSGAHMNPAVTLAFLWLEKIAPADAAWYIAAQVVGGISGVLVAIVLFGEHVRHPAVNHVITEPGPRGRGLAFGAECLISFMLFLAILAASNSRSWMAYTGLVAGALVAVYITVEAPYSGMSINPARTLGSAVWARSYRGLWLYFIAPPVGMLAAAAVYAAAPWTGGHARCAKLNHSGQQRCIFRCEIDLVQGLD